jgi:hypothetical protein
MFYLQRDKNNVHRGGGRQEMGVWGGIKEQRGI